MGDVLDRHAQQLLLGIAEDLAEAAVDAHKAAGDDFADAGSGQLEGLAKALLALAQRALGLSARGDVADGGNDAVEVALARALQKASIDVEPGDRLVRAHDADDMAGERLAGAHCDPRRPVLRRKRRAVLTHAG